MAAQVPSSHDISAVAKDENGPVKGSQSAQMQSQVGKVQVCQALLHMNHSL